MFQSRIVGHGEVRVADVLPNPQNWRGHPQRQAEALGTVLSEVGIIQGVIVNRSTGHLVDGHLRVELARRAGMETIPCTFVDLDIEEEETALATFDPIAALAEPDPAILGALVAQVAASSEALGEVVAELFGVAEGEQSPSCGDDPRDGEAGEEGDSREEEEPGRFALAVVLDNAQWRAWTAYKERLGVARDQTAFERMLEEAA